MLRPALLLLVASPLFTAHSQADDVLWPAAPRAAESGHVLFRLREDQHHRAMLWQPGEDAPTPLFSDHGSVLDLAWWPGHLGGVLALIRDDDGKVRLFTHDLNEEGTPELELPSGTDRIFPQARWALLLSTDGEGRRAHILDLESWDIRSTKITAPELQGATAGERAVLAAQSEDRAQLVSVNPETLDMEPIGRVGARIDRLSLSPDGQKIAFIAPSQSGPAGLWTWSIGASQPKRHAEATRFALGDDLAAPVWSDGNIYTETIDAGRLRWSRIDLQDGTVTPLSPRDLDAGTATRAKESWIAIVSDAGQPPELASLGATGQVLHRTNFNEGKAADIVSELLDAWITRSEKAQAVFFHAAGEEASKNAVVLLRSNPRGAPTREYDPVVVRAVRAGLSVLSPAPGTHRSYDRRYRGIVPFLSVLARKKQITGENLAVLATGEDTAFGLWLTLNTQQFVGAALVARQAILGSGPRDERAFGGLDRAALDRGFFPDLVTGRRESATLWIAGSSAGLEMAATAVEQLEKASLPTTSVEVESIDEAWELIGSWLAMRREAQGLSASEPAPASEFGSVVMAGTLAKARVDMKMLHQGVERYIREFGYLPNTLRSLLPLPSETSGFIDLRQLPRDPWDNPYILRGSVEDFEILSLGRDNRLGGEGEDADLTSRDVR
ncbi:MAG: type II secretion system protein GspG [Planctomycetota bacterium]